MKKFLSGLIVGMILMCAIPSLAKTETVQAIYNGVKVAVNGENITFTKGEEPVTINNRTYVPAKYVAEALDATVTWDSKSSTVNIKSEEVKDVPLTNTETTDYTVPEIDESDNLINSTILQDDDNFELITYKGLKALKFKEIIYISYYDLSKTKHIKAKFDSKKGTYKLYKNDELIFETLDKSSTYFVNYKGYPYFNAQFLEKYLED